MMKGKSQGAADGRGKKKSLTNQTAISKIWLEHLVRGMWCCDEPICLGDKASSRNEEKMKSLAPPAHKWGWEGDVRENESVCVCIWECVCVCARAREFYAMTTYIHIPHAYTKFPEDFWTFYWLWRQRLRIMSNRVNREKEPEGERYFFLYNTLNL